MTWNAAGTYFETCNCEAACPCVFLGPPTEGDCTAMIGWHIDRGEFDGLSVEGLNVALAVHSPGQMTDGNWRVALYLDDRASEAQAEALGAMFSGAAGGHPAVLGGFIGEVMGVAPATITFDANDSSVKLYGRRVGRREHDRDRRSRRRQGLDRQPPVAVAPGNTAVVARAEHFRFADHGYEWAITGRNGFFSPFQYEADRDRSPLTHRGEDESVGPGRPHRSHRAQLGVSAPAECPDGRHAVATGHADDVGVDAHRHRAHVVHVGGDDGGDDASVGRADGRRLRHHPFLRPHASAGVHSLFITGYLAAWSVFAAGATLAQWLLHEQALVDAMGTSSSRWLGGFLLVSAGVYQFTGLRRRASASAARPSRSCSPTGVKADKAHSRGASTTVRCASDAAGH